MHKRELGVCSVERSHHELTVGELDYACKYCHILWFSIIIPNHLIFVPWTVPYLYIYFASRNMTPTPLFVDGRPFIGHPLMVVHQMGTSREISSQYMHSKSQILTSCEGFIKSTAGFPVTEILVNKFGQSRQLNWSFIKVIETSTVSENMDYCQR